MKIEIQKKTVHTSYLLRSLANLSPPRYKTNTVVEPTKTVEILLKVFAKSVYEQRSLELRFKVYSSRQIVRLHRSAFAFVRRALFLFLFYCRFHNSRRTRNVIDGTNRSHGINPK